MARIAILENPLDLSDVCWSHHDGPFIDWLVDRYPSGFPGPTVVALNRQKLDVIDYDVELQPDDELVLVTAPTGTGIIEALIGGSLIEALAGAAITAAVSLGVNTLVNALFGPGDIKGTPASLQTPSPSPVYSLSVPTNQARLGEVIPVIYGEVLTVPDICSQPYTYYQDNEQYLVMLLCLGQATHTIKDIQIADTPVEQLPAGVFQWWNCPQSIHQSQIGPIYAFTGIRENVDTSPEVSDQELVTGSTSTVFYDGAVQDSAIIMMDGAFSLAINDAVEVAVVGAPTSSHTVTNVAGQDVTVSPATLATTSAPYVFRETPATGLFTTGPDTLRIDWTDPFSYAEVDVGDTVTVEVEYLGGVTTYDGTVASVSPGTYEISVTGSTGPGLPVGSTVDLTYAELTRAGSANPAARVSKTVGSTNAIGPFNVCGPAVQIFAAHIDVTFPSGLYKVDDTTGALLPNTVDLRYTFEPIDSDGAPTGGTVIVRDHKVTVATNTPVRQTISVPLPVARYRCKAERLSPMETRAQDQSRVIWTGLKGFIANSGPAYDDTHILAVKIKATNGIARDAINRIGVRCTRDYLDFAGEAYKDVITNTKYGAARPDSEIDQDVMDTLTDPFNAVFDFKSSIWEAITRICQVSYANPVTVSSVFSAVYDVPRTVVKFAFTGENTVIDSVEARYRFDGVDEIDGYEVEFRDPVSFQADYKLHPSTAVDPESTDLFGCTDPDVAQRWSEYLWNRRKYRRKYVSWTTELDGHLPQIGDLVTVESEVLGETPEQIVISAIAPQDRYIVRLEGFRYDERVYS